MMMESSESSAFASAPNNSRLRAILGVVGVVALTSCNETPTTLSTSEFVGRYPLAQVDGRALGWYHQLNGVDCRAAFAVGELSISTEMLWRLVLDYDYRCLGAVPGDGEARLVTGGSVVRSTPDLIILNGYGPDPVNPAILASWTIEVRPSGESVEVRFTGRVREFWADPILTMGPRE